MAVESDLEIVSCAGKGRRCGHTHPWMGPPGGQYPWGNVVRRSTREVVGDVAREFCERDDCNCKVHGWTFNVLAEELPQGRVLIREFGWAETREEALAGLAAGLNSATSKKTAQGEAKSKRQKTHISEAVVLCLFGIPCLAAVGYAVYLLGSVLVGYRCWSC